MPAYVQRNTDPRVAVAGSVRERSAACTLHVILRLSPKAAARRTPSSTENDIGAAVDGAMPSRAMPTIISSASTATMMVMTAPPTRIRRSPTATTTSSRTKTTRIIVITGAPIASWIDWAPKTSSSAL